MKCKRFFNFSFETNEHSRRHAHKTKINLVRSRRRSTSAYIIKLFELDFFSAVAAAAALSIHFHFFLLSLSFFCYFFVFFSGRPKLEIAWKTLLFAGRLVRRRRRHIMRSSIKTNTKYKLKINNLTLCQIMGTEE